MANVTVTVPTSNITVDTTNSIVNVATTTSNVLVGESVFISNADVRAAISVSNESGFGNLAYDNSTGSNGIIQYTGVSTSDIRGQISASPTNPGDGSVTYNATSGVILYTGPDSSDYRAAISATAPITYNSGTGVIDIDSGAVFSGKTTDDLAQGTQNIYFSQSGAAVNTDNLPQGTTNKYFTTDNANAAILDYEGALPGITTLNASGNISLGGNLNITRASAEQVYVNGNNNNKFTLAGFDEVSLRAQTLPESGSTTGPMEIMGSEINLWADSTSGGASNIILGNPTFLNPSSVNIDHNIRCGGPLVMQGGYAKSMGENTSFFKIQTLATTGITGYVRTHADFNHRGNANIYIDPHGRADITAGFRLMNNANTSVFSVNHLGTTSIAGTTTITGNLTVNSDSVINGNLQVQGNIDYVNSEDLLVKDQSISLNVGNVVQDAMIIVDRQGIGGGSNVELKWNESTDSWQFTNDGSTYNNMLTSALSRALISTTTPAAASGGGALAYNNTTGALTFTPAVPGIALSALSVTQAGASGTGSLAYNNTSGVFTYTPPVSGINSVNGLTGSSITLTTSNIAEGTNLYYTQSRVRSDVDGETASATGTGSLVYDSATGMFTMTPPDVAGIAKTALSTTTAAASGGGALAYDNGTGVFTFTPAVENNDTQIVNGTTSITIPVADSNIDLQVGGTVTAVVSTGLVDITGNITASENIRAVQASASDIGAVQAINGQSTLASYNNRVPFVNTETGILAVQASTTAGNLYSIPRYSSIKFPDIPANVAFSNGQFTPDNIESIGVYGGLWDNIALAMPPSSLVSVIDPKIHKQRGLALPAYNIPMTSTGSTPHATGTIIFDTDSANAVVQSKETIGIIAGVPGYFSAPLSQGIIKFRTLQPAIAPDLPTQYVHTTANDFANSTVAYIDDKLRVGREDNSTSFSFPKTAGAVNQTLVLDGSRDLGFEDKGQTISYTTTEINALASPVTGHVVYNSTLAKLCFYNGSSWQQVTSTNM